MNEPGNLSTPSGEKFLIFLFKNYCFISEMPNICFKILIKAKGLGDKAVFYF